MTTRILCTKGRTSSSSLNSTLAMTCMHTIIVSPAARIWDASSVKSNQHDMQLSDVGV